MKNVCYFFLFALLLSLCPVPAQSQSITIDKATKKLAKQGDPVAQYKVAFNEYAKRRGKVELKRGPYFANFAEKDKYYMRPVALFELSAQQGYVPAMIELAHYYNEFVDVRDVRRQYRRGKVLDWLSKAEKSGDTVTIKNGWYTHYWPNVYSSGYIAGIANIHSSLGRCYDNIGQYEQAITNFKQAVKEGDKQSTKKVAFIYYLRCKDYKQAVEWYMNVDSLDEFDKSCLAGSAYEYASELEKAGAVENAMEYYTVAISQKARYDSYHAAEKMGNIYYKTDSVRKDYDKAISVFELAKELGSTSAVSLIAELSQKARYASYHAAEKMGNIYKTDSVRKDYDKAISFFELAKELGSTSAVSLIAECKDLKQKKEQELQWQLAKAEFDKTKPKAVRGNTAAQVKLGDMYYFGKGVSKDYAEALKWWRKAAAKGNAAARYSIAVCYYRGNGVAKSIAQAKQWAQKAASAGNADGKKLLATIKADEQQAAEKKRQEQLAQQEAKRKQEELLQAQNLSGQNEGVSDLASSATVKEEQPAIVESQKITAAQLFQQAYTLPNSESNRKMELYKQVLTEDPYDREGYKAAAYINIGVIYDQAGDLKSARTCFEYALQVDASNSIAQENLKDVKRRIRQEKWSRIGTVLGAVGQAAGNMGNALNSGRSTNYNNYNSAQGNYNAGSFGNGTSQSGATKARNTASNHSRTCPVCRGSGECMGISKSKCNGSGKCQYCLGEKYDYTNGHAHTCGACNGTGKCRSCRGTGKCKFCNGRGVQ